MMTEQTRVAVLMPTKGRAWQFKSRAAELLWQELPAGVELLLVVAPLQNDTESLRALDELLYMPKNEQVTIIPAIRPAQDDTAVKGWNKAYYVARWENADWFVLGADDIIWHEGWLAQALAAARPGIEVVGLNDGHTNLDAYGPHYMVSRRFAEEELGGYMVPPEYKAWWFDREVCERAQALGVYAPAWNAWVEHRHPDWRTAALDETYRAAWPDHEADRAVYETRRER